MIRRAAIDPDAASGRVAHQLSFVDRISGVEHHVGRRHGRIADTPAQMFVQCAHQRGSLVTI